MMRYRRALVYRGIGLSALGTQLSTRHATTGTNVVAFKRDGASVCVRLRALGERWL